MTSKITNGSNGCASGLASKNWYDRLLDTIFTLAAVALAGTAAYTVFILLPQIVTK